jgi:hypothetical protein
VAKGYRVAPRPAWVIDPPAAPVSSAAAPNNASGGRRELLLDLQVNHALPRMQYYLRTRSVAADNQALGAVSQPRIQFNPAFQTVTLHSATVTRDGRTLDRLKDARIEVLRRETQLDRQMIDGTETLLVVLSDVRVGESVEMAYSIEGANPIFDSRIAGVVAVATGAPVDVLHERVIVPADRNVQVRGIGGDVVPERKVEGNRHVLSLLRTQVPAVIEEQATPPWFKVYPAWQYSEYASWSEVDAWARRLFAPAAQPGPLLRERVEAWRASTLKGDALVADVLRFVQDEVRYFSVSLGESSHRPKPAERTLTERMGDCKDKVVLLNTLATAAWPTICRPTISSIMSSRRSNSTAAPGTSMPRSRDRDRRWLNEVTIRMGMRWWLELETSFSGWQAALRIWIPSTSFNAGTCRSLAIRRS